MSVCQHVLDMTAGARETFERVTGASFQEAFAVLSERELQTTNARIGSDPRADRPLERQKPRACGAFAEAAEGTRTLDLLHGKQTL